MKVLLIEKKIEIVTSDACKEKDTKRGLYLFCDATSNLVSELISQIVLTILKATDRRKDK